MKVGIVLSRLALKKKEEIAKRIEGLGLDYEFVTNLDESIQRLDLLSVIGNDKDVLKTFQEMRDKTIPLLGISDSDELGFLTERSISQLEDTFKKLINKDFKVEESSRINVNVDDREEAHALNDIALFPKKSATLMEYRLLVNDEFIWRDYSDGLIISTPTGSTAYAMSAGGPALLPSSKAFVIVPVNSMDITRKPLVINEESPIYVNEIVSRVDCEVIVDGVKRIKIKRFFKANKSKASAKLIRLAPSPALERLSKKVKLAEELIKMPPSAKLVLKTLQYEGPLTRRDLIEKTMLPERTIRMALSILAQKGLIKRKSMLRDARRKLYHAL